MPVNAERRKKLSELLPEGVITTPAWLMKNGIARPAIDNLVKSGSLTTLHHGVYVRGSVPLQWQAIVYSLQSILETNLVIGGLSSLEMQGLTHYLSFSEKRTIHLYGMEKMPTWLNTLLPDVTFRWHSEKDLLGRKKKLLPAEAKSLHAFVVEREWREGFANLQLSSPERALLEVLMDVPENISFEHADQLLQGMTSLSPRSLQELLESCGNIKVRRLFFWLSDRHNYAWLHKLDKTRIDFGSGNRMLIKGGKLDKKYKISVPEFL
ncbi:MAG TPA: type IV toxin-antitoxin system AbiEi family antitoxin domain-containing protein [Chryseolinea sp.]